MSKDIISESILKNGKLLTLRKAERGDAEKVLEYLNIVGGESGNLTFGRDGFKDVTVKTERETIKKINDAQNSIMLLGFADERLVSVALITGGPRARVAHNFELSISVSKAYWGMGVGTAMISKLIEFAKDHGALTVHLGVRADNAPAIHLYEKFGFVKTGLRKGFFNIDGEYFDEILMDLYLT